MPLRGALPPPFVLAVSSAGVLPTSSRASGGIEQNVLLQAIREATRSAGRLWEGTSASLARSKLGAAHVTLLQLLLAIAISLVGASLTVVGMIVQKFSHQEAEKQDARDCDLPLVAGCVSTRWLFGLGLFGLGNLVTWVALGLAPNSVLACFNSWNIVFAMVVAPAFLGEQVSQGAKRSAILLMLGCVWVTCAGPRSYRLETVESINLLFTKLPFTICSIALLTILVVVRIRIALWQHIRDWKSADILQVTLTAAIFGTYAVIFSKCTSMVVQSSVLEHEDGVGRWQFYLWAGLTLLFGLLQISFLNESLRHGKASFVIPAYQSMSMALQIVVGGIFFREYSRFKREDHLRFWPAVVLVVIGVVALTRSAQLHEEEAEAQAEKAELATSTSQEGVSADSSRR